MTDKQIIIDGVDVADCEHINACDKKMKCVILQDDVCETNPYCEGFNCYYKQLKCKEQECEELKDLANHNGRICNERLDKIDKLEYNINELNEQLEAYKMEAEEGKEINAELKAELTRANCQIADDEILQCDMREAIEGLKAENERLKNAVMLKCPQCGEVYLDPIGAKLYETLTEIKEIAETASKCMYATYSDDYTEGYRWLGSIILQKISECEGNNG